MTTTTRKPFNRLLLTGAAGGLGQVLREALQAHANIVRVSDISPMAAAAGEHEQVINCDLADKAGVLALAGCDQLPHKPVVPDEEVQAQGYPARLANGSIYQSSRSQPLFEDRRPRMVGDTLTIELEEQVSASKTSTIAR